MEFLVMSADIDPAIGYGWRGGDPITKSLNPLPLAREGVKGIEVAILGTNIDQTISYYRISTNIRTYSTGPFLLTCSGIKGVEESLTLIARAGKVARADIDQAVGDRWGAIDFTNGRSSPLRLARSRIEDMELVVFSGADIDQTIGHCRGGETDTTGRHSPLRLAVGRIEGIEIAVSGANIHQAIGYGW